MCLFESGSIIVNYMLKYHFDQYLGYPGFEKSAVSFARWLHINVAFCPFIYFRLIGFTSSKFKYVLSFVYVLFLIWSVQRRKIVKYVTLKKYVRESLTIIKYIYVDRA
jgi:hypothetical protein